MTHWGWCSELHGEQLRLSVASLPACHVESAIRHPIVVWVAIWKLHVTGAQTSPQNCIPAQFRQSLERNFFSKLLFTFFWFCNLAFLQLLV
jgi:hypothetical protein